MLELASGGDEGGDEHDDDGGDARTNPELIGSGRGLSHAPGTRESLVVGVLNSNSSHHSIPEPQN